MLTILKAEKNGILFRNSHILLVEMKNSTVTLEDSLTVSYKIR